MGDPCSSSSSTPLREEPLNAGLDTPISIRRTLSQRWPHTSRLSLPIITIGGSAQEGERSDSSETESIPIVNQERVPYFPEDTIDREAIEREERERIAAGPSAAPPQQQIPVRELTFEQIRQADFQGLLDGYTFRKTKMNGITRMLYSDERFERFVRNTRGDLRFSDIGNPPAHVHVIRNRADLDEQAD